MAFLVIAIIIGLIPAAIAQSKGHSFVLWWIYGSLLFIVALPHSLFMGTDAREIDRRELASGARTKCPYCAELIRPEAIICPHCRQDLRVDTCSLCGAEAGPDERFCASCGAEFEVAGAQRRYQRRR
jgi:hypothetical protein